MANSYLIKRGARGVFRHKGVRIGYNFAPGKHPASDIPPLVLERLESMGLATPVKTSVKKASKKEDEQ